MQAISEATLTEKLYNVHKLPCECTPAKKNCKHNPNCKHGLGYKLRSSAVYNDKVTLPDIRALGPDPMPNMRGKDAFPGLLNLGATCYMGVLIQTLYLNYDFRRIILAYKPQADNGDMVDMKDNDGVLEVKETKKRTDSVMIHLQQLFASLKLTNQKAIDPTQFAEALSLPKNEQQDVQEFLNLLLTYVEGQVKQPALSARLKELFTGTLTNVTQCKSCKYRSARESEFNILQVNIDGQDSVNTALAAYFASEKLEGSNQYLCPTCAKKRNAERGVELTAAPDYLNLQLMRFRFDWEKQTKVKIKTAVHIPEALDLAPYFGEEVRKANLTEDSLTSIDHANVPPEDVMLAAAQDAVTAAKKTEASKPAASPDQKSRSSRRKTSARGKSKKVESESELEEHKDEYVDVSESEELSTEPVQTTKKKKTKVSQRKPASSSGSKTRKRKAKVIADTGTILDSMIGHTDNESQNDNAPLDMTVDSELEEEEVAVKRRTKRKKPSKFSTETRSGNSAKKVVISSYSNISAKKKQRKTAYRRSDPICVDGDDDPMAEVVDAYADDDAFLHATKDKPAVKRSVRNAKRARAVVDTTFGELMQGQMPGNGLKGGAGGFLDDDGVNTFQDASPEKEKNTTTMTRKKKAAKPVFKCLFCDSTDFKDNHDLTEHVNVHITQQDEEASQATVAAMMDQSDSEDAPIISPSAPKTQNKRNRPQRTKTKVQFENFSSMQDETSESESESSDVELKRVTKKSRTNDRKSKPASRTTTRGKKRVGGIVERKEAAKKKKKMKAFDDSDSTIVLGAAEAMESPTLLPLLKKKCQQRHPSPFNSPRIPP